MVRQNKLLQDWASEQLKLVKGKDAEISMFQTISGDASFRRYYRLQSDGDSFIAVDAPPDTENNPAFVAIADALVESGLDAPIVYALDISRGYMLLSDLGDQQLLGLLNSDTVDAYYRKALSDLVLMQKLQAEDLQRSENDWAFSCPDYDLERLQNEMLLFSDWFLPQYLDLSLDESEQGNLEQTYGLLAKSALEQPKVFVHRDYHSRNIMVKEDGKLAHIDFQDGVIGPISYDMVSLLKDCYISWPKEQVEGWVKYYGEEAAKAGLFDSNSNDGLNNNQLLKWFDWMGIQRHLKAIGIFARLNIRDQKPGYLKDIPRTFNYILEASRGYPELAEFHQLMLNRVLPKLLAVNPEAEKFIDRLFIS